jgi:hypothetical protein
LKPKGLKFIKISSLRDYIEAQRAEIILIPNADLHPITPKE